MIKILLSAYNGEKCIEEQIESILSQTYSDYEIYIRDDGSKDNTREVLKKYEKYENIFIEYGENLGFIKSFLWLVKNCGDADYFAFCDQDDKWLPKKLEMAIEMLANEDDSKPLLYFSNYDFYDNDMKFVEHGKKPILSPSFHNSVVDCMTLGFNSVFNRKAHEIICANIPQKSCGHDWWTYMVCAGLGKVVYDDRVTVCYRRTGNNVSPGGKDFWKMQLWRLKKFFLNDYFANIREMLREYYSLYSDELSKEDCAFLALFQKEKYSFINALKKVCYPHRLRSGVFDELCIRIIFLIGKM